MDYSNDGRDTDGRMIRAAHRDTVFVVRMKKCLRKTILIGFMVLQFAWLENTQAQSAPSAREVASYEGLHKSAHDGDIEATLANIKAGADLEARDPSGRTPLIVAAFASNDAIVKVLAEAGADLNALENQAYDIVTVASVANDISMVDLALKLGASASNVTSPYDGTALIAAAHLGHHQVVDLLIKGNAPLDHVNNLDWTALIEAVVLGDGGADHIQTVKLLLQAGADQRIGDRQGITPLEHAKSRGYAEIAQLLIDSQ